ncbi:MAG: hypothetical protein WCI81_06305, partial [Chlorobiaceae bacterium]
MVYLFQISNFPPLFIFLLFLIFPRTSREANRYTQRGILCSENIHEVTTLMTMKGEAQAIVLQKANKLKLQSAAYHAD